MTPAMPKIDCISVKLLHGRIEFRLSACRWFPVIVQKDDVLMKVRLVRVG